jgi:hypothetical protein
VCAECVRENYSWNEGETERTIAAMKGRVRENYSWGEGESERTKAGMKG